MCYIAAFCNLAFGVLYCNVSVLLFIIEGDAYCGLPCYVVPHRNQSNLGAVKNLTCNMQHATCKHWGAGTFESLSVLTDLKLGKTTTTGGGGIGEGNQLVAVPSMRGLDRLRSLELSNNNLTDIPAGAPLYAAIPRIFFSLFYLCSAVSRHRCALTSQVCPVIYIYKCRKRMPMVETDAVVATMAGRYF